jgi:hypothetical protein
LARGPLQPLVCGVCIEALKSSDSLRPLSVGGCDWKDFLIPPAWCITAFNWAFAASTARSHGRAVWAPAGNAKDSTAIPNSAEKDLQMFIATR